jgi:hypothetical protein
MDILKLSNSVNLQRFHNAVQEEEFRSTTAGNGEHGAVGYIWKVLLYGEQIIDTPVPKPLTSSQVCSCREVLRTGNEIETIA